MSPKELKIRRAKKLQLLKEEMLSIANNATRRRGEMDNAIFIMAETLAFILEGVACIRK